ncbi:MAG: SprT family zinc-dependent metalloprotease [Anaerolineaceae bacterium]|nr:SprT family zinc-dependent metalloprotease [Anaerolineaceae bacterium]
MIDGIDELIYSKRKCLTLTVVPGGKTVLRVPLKTKEALIEAFLKAHEVWIVRARQRMASLPPPPAPYQFAHGEQLLYLGKLYPLAVVEKQPGGLAFLAGQGFKLERQRRPEGPKLFERFLREETRRLCQAYLAHYAPLLGAQYGLVRINNAKTRWGSCSAKNALNFSLRLALTPLACLEYVAVHELCHTRCHHHGPAFWNLVEELLPNFREPRAWLKKHGGSLPPIGE